MPCSTLPGKDSSLGDMRGASLTPFASMPAGCSQLETGVSLQGGQGLAAGPRASLNACYNACSDRAECTAFTFVPYQKMCYLRGGTASGH